MDRRNFIASGSILTAGLQLKSFEFFSEPDRQASSLYSLFKDPPTTFKPFVRWWWNGDKIEKEELTRELKLLKDAGIGGVEINPVKFPARTDSLGKNSVPWLSKEWIELLQFTFDEAKSLGLTCDLIVGSGWPFGAEWLEGEERSQAIVIGIKKLEGPLDYEVSLFDLFKEADPAISSPFPGRTMEMLSVQLAPSIINSIGEAIDLSSQIPNGTIRYKIPDGKHVLYAMVKIHGFAQVIQGAPGATGPVLNHYNKAAVEKYLNKMSGSIQQQIGPLSSKIRSLFTDSLELEGANWCSDMKEEFEKRRGYDLMPWLPFILFKLENLGNTWVYDYTAEHGPDFKEMINRIRYDFELTKAELIKERFLDTFIDWCKQNKILSRMQAYGRGYFPLEGSFSPDVPECETWIRTVELGKEMNESDYRIGRAYTMINKFVSSAAHLKDKKLISCEELTNTNLVFNESLELMKIAGDQSIISGVTHPIFHGFNYSPTDAPFPGWVIYGCYINEKNPWWPWFRLFTDYKARLSAMLQQGSMYADIAILPPVADTWSIHSAQNEPFPVEMYPPWQTFIWEAIHQNGNGCDYISETVIQNAKIKDGTLSYGPRKYHSIFLPQVDSIEPATVKQLFDFVSSGGSIFFIQSYPLKAPGWKDHEQRDAEVKEWIEKMKSFSKNCILLTKPEKDFINWYKNVQQQYNLLPYVKIDSPNPFISQIRYQAQGAEILIFINSNMDDGHSIMIEPSNEIIAKKQAWIWDPETGERYKLNPGNIKIDLGPSDLKIIVFDKEHKGTVYKPLKVESSKSREIKDQWKLRGEHIDGRLIRKEIDILTDLKDDPQWVDFCGSLIYRNTFTIDDSSILESLNLGKVYGISDVFLNDMHLGPQWYGRRIYDIKQLIKHGENIIEVWVTTTMGNYMKSLKDNKVAQYWTNEGRKIQPLHPMGMIGPVSLY